MSKSLKFGFLMLFNLKLNSSGDFGEERISIIGTEFSDQKREQKEANTWTVLDHSSTSFQILQDDVRRKSSPHLTLSRSRSLFLPPQTETRGELRMKDLPLL